MPPAAKKVSVTKPAWQLGYEGDSQPLPPCPFTGKQLTEFNPKDQNGAPLFGARGEFFTTRLFPVRRQLFYWLAHRNGTAPDFDASGITTRERQPAAPNAFQDVVDKNKVIDEVAKQVVTEKAKDLKLRA